MLDWYCIWGHGEEGQEYMRGSVQWIRILIETRWVSKRLHLILRR